MSPMTANALKGGMLLCTIVAGSCFAGAGLLWGALRFLAPAGRGTYGSAMVAFVCGSLVALAFCVGFGLAGSELAEPQHTVLACVGLLAGAVGLVLVVKTLARVSAMRAVYACLPLVLVYIAAGASLIPTTHLLSDLDWGPVCISNLTGIGHAVRMHLDKHNGEYPKDLCTLIDDGQPSEMVRCPASGLRYYYHAPPSASPDKPVRIIACDRGSDHPGGYRNVLYSDGSV